MGFELRNLSVFKGQKEILTKIACELPMGALTVVVGPNGAGKSTLLRCLAGLEKPSSGAVYWEGRGLLSLTLKERTRLLSWSPAENRPSFAYSCLDLVVMGRFPYHDGYPSKRDFAVARESLERLGLEEFVDLPSHRLSSGALKRLILARSLASMNPVLIFDEPEAHLDLAWAFRVMELLKDLSKEGRTICMSLHNLSLASQFADHLVLLENASCVASGGTGKIFTAANISKVFGIGFSKVKSASQEQIVFHSLSQNLSGDGIDGKGVSGTGP